MELAEGMVVADKFKLVRMIGKGGMGSVWAAEQLALDRPCAVKFIEGELGNVTEAHERFKREARAAAQLGQSPHVVQTYDHGVWQGKPYIAMELLNGRDLGKTLLVRDANGEKLALSEIHDIMAQVCRALSKAHQAGIVHRDLKPDNIFLVNEDDGSGKALVKILDFGVAKATGQAIDGSNTKTGAMLGTPYYMSPEQAQGIKSVDARSDLWSLAVIVYQCVTGRLPFESEALGDLLVKIIVNPVPSMGSVCPDVTPELEEWWRKASERSVEKRFQTAKEFAESLNRAIAASTGGVTAVHEMRRTDQQRVGGATAMMSNNTPGNMQGQQYTHALGMTPQPGAQGPFQNTPHPHMNTPHPGTGAYVPNATTGSGIGVFAGPPAEAPLVPRKGPPVALIAAFAALFLVGAGAAGVALMKSRTAAEAPTVAASAPPPPEATDVSPPKPADPPPAETAKQDPPPAETAKPAETVAAKPAEPAPKPIAAKPQPATAKPPPAAPPPVKPATPPKPTGGVAPGF